MTRTVGGSLAAALMMTAVGYSIAIPLGWSNGALGVILVVATVIAGISHTNHLARDSQRRRAKTP